MKDKSIFLTQLFFIISYLAFGLLIFFLIIKQNLLIYGNEPHIVEMPISAVSGYKDLLKGNFSILEPNLYLYGSLYSYLIIPISFLYYLSSSLIPFVSLTKEGFYIISRMLNATLIIFSSLIIFYLSTIISNRKVTILFVGIIGSLFITIPIVFARSQFINQDVVSLFFFLSFLAVFLNYIRKPQIKYLIFSSILIGLTIAGKQSYIVILPLTFIFLVSSIPSKKKVLWLLMFGTILLLVYFAVNPFYVIHFKKFTATILNINNIETAFSLDANYTFTYYIKNILSYFWPLILGALIILFVERNTKTTINKIIKNKITLFIIIQILILFCFISIQERKLDRWGLPIYTLTFILLITFLLIKLSKYKYLVLTIVFSQLILNIVLLKPLVEFFINKDPRISLLSFVSENNDSKILLLNEHGNILKIDQRQNVTIIKYPNYKKDDIRSFTPDYLYGNYNYLIVSNGIIRDIYNRNNQKKYMEIEKWHQYLESLKINTTSIIGSKRIFYEPMIGYTIFKN